MARYTFLCLCALLPVACGSNNNDSDATPQQDVTSESLDDTLPTWNMSKTPWPMFAGNVRRTGQSMFNGPKTATADSARNWQYVAEGGASINMQGVLTDEGVYFGTWGVLRKTGLQPVNWDKADGHYYGLHLEKQATPQAQEIFPPLLPAVTPVGYLYPGRDKLPRDEPWTGKDNDYLVSWYNGTIEGSPCIDPDNGLHYVGRGDGKLYAIDPVRGRVVWAFETFNPELPDDPDGGGEILSGPVMGKGKVIYFGTAGVPWPEELPDNPIYETHAVYAVTPEGELLWRYPSDTARLDNPFAAYGALSVDGDTLYMGTFGLDVNTPGILYAFDLTQPANASDEQRLRWQLPLINDVRDSDLNVFIAHISVGIDDVIYVSGSEPQFLGAAPVLFAVRDNGDHAEFVWDPNYIELHGYPSFKGQSSRGLALRESSDDVETIFVTTHHIGRFNGRGGTLFAVDPGNGSILASFDPQQEGLSGIGGMTNPTLGADGTIYLGIRGLSPLFNNEGTDGYVYALEYKGDRFDVLWEYQVDGQLDWVPPMIGANGGLYFGSSDEFSIFDKITFFDKNEVPENASPFFYAVFE